MVHVQLLIDSSDLKIRRSLTIKLSIPKLEYLNSMTQHQDIRMYWHNITVVSCLEKRKITWMKNVQGFSVRAGQLRRPNIWMMSLVKRVCPSWKNSWCTISFFDLVLPMPSDGLTGALFFSLVISGTSCPWVLIISTKKLGFSFSHHSFPTISKLSNICY